MPSQIHLPQLGTQLVALCVAATSNQKQNQVSSFLLDGSKIALSA